MRKQKLTSSYRLMTASAVAASALVATAGAEQPAAAPSAATPTTSAAATTSTAANTKAVSSAAFEKPAWLSDLAVGLKESWDNNLWLTSGDGPTKKQSSWVTTVSPKIGVNFAPLFDKDSGIQTLSLAYNPDYVLYHGSNEETYYAHRFLTLAKAKYGNTSVSVDNNFVFVDGSETAPTYLGEDGDRSAYATAAPRERRKQIQDRSKVSIQYDQEHWFVRPTASLLYYDMMTDQKKNPVGGKYQNYVDRNDVNGGLDLGYKLTSKWALTLGYRYGHQYQEKLNKAVDLNQLSSSGDYQRVLVGTEGKPLNWLTVSVQAGPDFRSYDASAPIEDKHLTTYYGEASFTADITSKDSLTFKYKQWQWASSTGKLPLFDSTYDLTYQRKVTSQLTLALQGKVSESDYTMGDPAAARGGVGTYRDDGMFTLSPSLTYAFNQHLSASLAYTMDLGRNLQQSHVDNADARQFDHHLITLGVLYKF